MMSEGFACRENEQIRLGKNIVLYELLSLFISSEKFDLTYIQNI